MTRIWRRHWLVAVAVLLLVAGTIPAWAAQPLRLPTPLTDEVGAVAGREAQVSQAAAALQRDAGIQQWTVYVDNFSGLSGQDWAAQTAQLSGLGGNDLLFAVATGERSYGYSTGDVAISDAEINRVMSRTVEPRLADGDWAGAAIGLSEGLAQSGTAAPTRGGGGGGLLLLFLLGALALLALLFLSRRKKAGKGSDGGGPGGPAAVGAAPVEEVRRQASSLLIAADDSLKTSEQELGFAEAQFGEEATTPFREALAASRADVARAFTAHTEAQQQAGTPAEQGLLHEVITLCTAADERLDAQVEAFDELRNLEANVPEQLPKLQAAVTALDGRVQAATTTAEKLAQQYPAVAISTVVSNLEEGVERIRIARESVAVGTELLEQNDRGGAVARARAAEEAIGQAGILLDSVDRAPTELQQARGAIEALVAETRKDIAEAEQLGISAELAPLVARARDSLVAAEQAVASGSFDPLAVRRDLDEADGALEDALVPMREAHVAKSRAQALLVTTAEAARASIEAANDFITTRRGGIGANPRTKLAEAQRLFNDATRIPDPEQALHAFQSADHLADQALAMAEAEAARAQQAMQPQRAGGGQQGMSMGNVVLAGILVDSLFGGRSGGGSGGRPGGRPSPGGFGGRPSPGSFGGPATRARRGGGGRF